MDVNPSNEPASWLFHQPVVMVTGIEEVVSLYVHFPFPLLPGDPCIDKGIGLVVADLAVEVGIGAYAILPSGSDVE
jgi:hypothetical protein